MIPKEAEKYIYYQEKDIVLLKGDCLEILPLLEPGSVDLVLTDPPYGINYKSGPNSSNSISSTGKRFSETIKNDDKPFNPLPFMSFKGVCMTGAQHYYYMLPDCGSFHVWNKRGDYKPIDQADGDLVWINKKLSLRIIKLVWRGLCRDTEHNEKIMHPTQKPIKLMEWCLDFFPDAQLILDPFLGSGTTAVAAKQLGRKCIGIELEKKYLDIAIERLRQEVLF